MEPLCQKLARISLLSDLTEMCIKITDMLLIMIQSKVMGSKISFLFPNPWHIKSKGKIILHIPNTLYADNTSGNTSKNWDKHISFFFNLSGLPSNDKSGIQLPFFIISGVGGAYF